MAAVATVSNVVTDKDVIGAHRMVHCTIAFDSSYPTGGEAITPDLFGLARIDNVIVQQAPGSSRLAEWDRTNSKIKLFTALGTEAANASDQSAITVRATIIGA